ncbi:hypothetical protein D3C76_1743750 [compost metagenome]
MARLKEHPEAGQEKWCSRRGENQPRGILRTEPYEMLGTLLQVLFHGMTTPQAKRGEIVVPLAK